MLLKIHVNFTLIIHLHVEHGMQKNFFFKIMLKYFDLNVLYEEFSKFNVHVIIFFSKRLTLHVFTFDRL